MILCAQGKAGERERLHLHAYCPLTAYEEMKEAEEEDIGGDTAELSYLARVARAAIAKAEGSA